MERSSTVQLAGQAMAMAWRPKSASHRQEMENFRNNLPGSSGVSYCCGRKNGERRLGIFVAHCLIKIHEPRLSKLQLFPCSSSSSSRSNNGELWRRAKRSASACSAVLNEVGGSSLQVPQGLASPDELKNQLEALQDEVLQVRNRHNNARARFMRLTEVAQQLRQRAALDLNLGNEDGARKALIEKQKVIQAAELSKRRAQLLEELSTKLGEAVSVKETQLIIALSSPQRKEPTVRVVTPKGGGASSVDQLSGKGGNPTVVGAAEASRIGHKASDSEDPAAAIPQDVKGDGRQVVPDSGDLLIEEEKESLAAELGYSIDRHLYGNEEDKKESSMELDSNKTNLPLGGAESVRDERDIDVQPGVSEIRKDFFQGTLSASGLNGGAESVSDIGHANSLSCVSEFHDIHNSESGAARNGDVDDDSFKGSPESGDSHNRGEEMGSDISLDDRGLLEQNDGRQTSREADFHDGRSRLLEEFTLELDKVADVESRIRTAVSGNIDINDVELQLVRDLLERVQSLRARTSEYVELLKQKEDTQ